jgi:hypothetical protein
MENLRCRVRIKNHLYIYLQITLFKKKIMLNKRNTTNLRLLHTNKSEDTNKVLCFVAVYNLITKIIAVGSSHF